jgi:hypothetical protein
MKQLSLKSKKVNLLFCFTEKKQVKKSTISISANWLRCIFVLVSLSLFAEVIAQVPGTPISLVVTPINTGGMIRLSTTTSIVCTSVRPSPAISGITHMISSGLVNYTASQIKHHIN